MCIKALTVVWCIGTLNSVPVCFLLMLGEVKGVFLPDGITWITLFCALIPDYILSSSV